MEFLKFQPGLGGHCIGVILIILLTNQKNWLRQPGNLAGRVINDGMAGYVVKKYCSTLFKQAPIIKTAKVLVMGATFKEKRKWYTQQ